MNTTEYSNDNIDAILVETSGKIGLVGSSNTNATVDYLLERLTENDSLDIAFGTNGRAAPGLAKQFHSKMRAVEQASGAITVVAGTGVDSIPTSIVTAFQLDTAGVLNAGFAPTLAAPSLDYTDICVGRSSRWAPTLRNDSERRNCNFAADDAGWHTGPEFRR